LPSRKESITSDWCCRDVAQRTFFEALGTPLQCCTAEQLNALFQPGDSSLAWSAMRKVLDHGRGTLA
jgi:hypothetical protein